MKRPGRVKAHTTIHSFVSWFIKSASKNVIGTSDVPGPKVHAGDTKDPRDGLECGGPFTGQQKPLGGSSKRLRTHKERYTDYKATNYTKTQTPKYFFNCEIVMFFVNI